jgi:hypothetical protein
MLNDLLHYLVENHKEQSKELFEYVLKKYPNLVIDFCELIRGNYEDKKYFYQKIEQLWALATEAAKQAVVYLLTIGRKRDHTQYEKKDLSYIETVITEGNRNAMGPLSVALPGFMDLDPGHTLKLCSAFIASAPMHEAELLIHSLFEPPGFTAKYKDHLKDFAFNSTLSLQIAAHYVDFVYSFLERDFDFDTMFSFMVKRTQWISEKIGWHAIDFSTRYGNPKLSVDQREAVFTKVIDWYRSVDDPSSYVHLKLVEYFLPERTFSASMREKMEALVSNCGDNFNAIVKICKALDAYDEKEGELLEFLISVGNRAVKMDGYNKETLIKIFGEDFIHNNGAKSKSGPGPFPVDVERHKLLTETLKKYEMEKDVRALFEYGLKVVDAAIKREEKEAEEEW